MKIFISTGEVSGDLQGSMLAESLFKAAQEQQIDLKIVGLGGERMKSAGVEVLAKYSSHRLDGFCRSGFPLLCRQLKFKARLKNIFKRTLPTYWF